MEYLNFEIRIGLQADQLYPAAVISAPSGETSAMISLPLQKAHFTNLLSQIQSHTAARSTRNAGHSNTELIRGLGLHNQNQVQNQSEIAKQLGTELFNHLFSGEIQSCFRISLHEARKAGKGLRIKLRIEAPEAATAPWEFLFDQTEEYHLSLSTQTPLIRFQELARPTQALATEPPLQVLGIIASPNDLVPLDVQAEKAQMEAAVQGLVDEGLLQLQWVTGQRWRDLQKAMREGPWHVLHFIGHGDFDTNKEEGILALADEDGSTYPLTASNLGHLLGDHPSIQLVILNSCLGARNSHKDLFSSTATTLIRRGIPAVVSMQFEITDRAAIEFSRTFYEAIANEFPVDAAVQEARKAINFSLQDTIEWGTPVLHMRTPDGHLFEVDMNSIYHPKAPPKDVLPPWESKQTTTSATATSPSTKDLQGLNILMQKVKQSWIEGVLESSVQQSALIELGIDNMPEMANSPWGKMPISAEQSISKVFDDLGRLLLIIGEPGSGKTISLLNLAKELLEQYSNAPNAALPVVFNLSSWTDSGQALGAWLVSELSTKYLIPKKIGEHWLQQNRMLLLLDGLDEVNANDRNACVLSINQFLQKAPLTGIVVCCRLKEYIDLNYKVNLNGAIRLRLLSREKIMNYLGTLGPAYQGLYQLLQKDLQLLKLAETPFMLNLMIRTYKDITPEALTKENAHSLQEHKSVLMNAYIKRQFRMAEMIHMS